jgi:hypothetical protein
MNVDLLAVRIRAEFLEMPGLRLTMRQAARLWGMDDETCHRVVDVLVTKAILRRQGGTIALASGSVQMRSA